MKRRMREETFLKKGPPLALLFQKRSIYRRLPSVADWSLPTETRTHGWRLQGSQGLISRMDVAAGHR